MTVPVVTTDRLVLREWRENDREPFADLNADPVVMEHFPSVLGVDESNAFFDAAVVAWQQRFGLWALEERVSGRFIGYTGFAAPTWKAAFTPCVEIGWRLRADVWGKGLATEAARAALMWGVHNLNPPRGEIVSFTTVGNRRSRRVMEKIGLIRDELADFDHPRLPEWEHRRHVLYRRSLSEIRSVLG